MKLQARRDVRRWPIAGDASWRRVLGAADKKQPRGIMIFRMSDLPGLSLYMLPHHELQRRLEHRGSHRMVRVRAFPMPIVRTEKVRQAYCLAPF